MSPKSLAGIVINPPVESDDLDRDMKIDQHLGEFGIKLSKKDMLSRYGRTEAADESDAAIRQSTQQPGLQSGLNAFANELKNKGKDSSLQLQLETTTSPLLAAFASDMSPVGKAIAELLDNPTPEAAAALVSRLPSLLPDDPAMAAILAEAMAKEFGVMLENAITNPCPKCHRQMSKDGRCTHCENLASNQKTVDGLVADLDLKGPDGKSKGWKDRTESLGELEQKTINDIKAANPKMNVDSSVATVSTEQLQHSLNHHGNAEREAKRGQIAITKDDLRRIPEVLADYDSIQPGKGIEDGKNQESVVFRKKYADGTVACVELDVYSDKLKKRALKFQTMWKEKN